MSFFSLLQHRSRASNAPAFLFPLYGVPMTTLVEDLILEELRRKGVAVEVESLKVV
jgi:hypothetical protein